jgi:hypothetical protein
MDKESLEGHIVTVESARGLITRTVVADLGEVLVLGSYEDYQLAKKDGIGRFSVGFRRSDVRGKNGIDT